MARLKKGSAAAKRYMAKIRGMRKGGKKRKTYKRAAASKRRSNPVARRKKKGRKKRSFTIPLAPTLGVVGALWHPLFGWSKWGWTGALPYAQRGDYANAIKDFTRISSMQIVGVDPEGDYPFGYFLGQGLLPIMIGCAVHKVASMLGLNRAIARSGLPFIRI